MLPGGMLGAAAQSEPELPGEWTEPVNLSESGGTTSPRFVVDSAGIKHVLWADESLGATYTRSDGEGWTQPVSLQYPFKDNVPSLVAGEGYVHIFWIEAGRNNSLQYARAKNENFGDPKLWEKTRTLTKMVSSFKASYGGGGRIDLLLARNAVEEENPEGVYYLASLNEGSAWEVEAPLYLSRYFRLLADAEINLNVDSTRIGESVMVSATWDNPSLKRVFYSRSTDGGITWEPASEVATPVGEDLSGAPFQIIHIADGERALRLWQSNLQSGLFCSTYYQTSNDGGETWSERAEILHTVSGCPIEKHLFVLADGNILLEGIVQEQVYLIAYDWERWSEPQPQSDIFGFANPATGDPVQFSCIQPVFDGAERLHLAGCDDGGGGDIWYTSRSVSDTRTWFPLPTDWTAPIAVTSTPYEIDAVKSLVDSQGRMNLFWVQYEPVEEGEEPSTRSIFHAFWDGQDASAANVIIRSPDKNVGDFSLAFDRSRNRLVIAWSGATSGEIYYSWADADLVESALEWADAVTIPAPHPSGRPPDIAVDADGVVYIAYTVPINEGRGIYLVKSTDGEKSWSDPQAVFTYDNSEWLAVGAPQLSLSADNRIHLTWTRENPFQEPSAVEMYYARTEVGGAKWTEPQIVTNDPVESITLLNTVETGLNRMWTTTATDTTNIFHDTSTDAGTTWSLPTNLSGLGEIPRANYPYINSRGLFTLAQIVETQSGRLEFKYQEWDGSAWKSGDMLVLPETAQDQIGFLTAGDERGGRLYVVYSVFRESSDDEEARWEIIALNRLPGSSPGAQPTLAVEPTPAAELSETPPTSPEVTAAPLPTAEFATPEATAPTISAAAEPTGTIESVEIEASVTPVVVDTNPSPAPAATLGPVLAGGIAILVVGVFFYLSQRRRKR